MTNVNTIEINLLEDESVQNDTHFRNRQKSLLSQLSENQQTNSLMLSKTMNNSVQTMRISKQTPNGSIALLESVQEGKFIKQTYLS